MGTSRVLAKFDATMNNHLRRFLSKVNNHHYLSHRIQNEHISQMSVVVSDNHIANIKRNKYYSIILDCTPDISHQEQLTVIIRFVDSNNSSVSIRE